MMNWHPDIDLDRLLAALSEEIIDTSDEDVRTLCGQVGAPLSGIARDMRKRIAAIAGGEAEPKLAPADIAIIRDVLFRSH
jgi:hypothetical protein